MSYRLYLDGMLMPVAPARIVARHRGRNRTTALLDGGEVTTIRAGERVELGLTLCLPRRPYPFARYQRHFLPPEVFLEHLMTRRRERVPIRFICARIGPGGQMISDTNLRVVLEDLSVSECAEDGDDVTIALTLREHQEYAATRVALEGQRVIVHGPARETDNRPQHQSHTVVRGDNLWNIARQFLGDGRRYREIFDLNQDQLRNPNLIFPGQVLRLPAA